MTKEQNAPSMLRFQLCQTMDTSSVVPAPSSTLIRGLYPKCVCFHPTKPLMAMGVSGYLAVYDLQGNTRVGRVDLKSVPVEMAFAPDGSVIIVVVQDWILYSISTTSWKARQIVPRRTKMDKPLESCLLAVAPGHNPLIYFARYAKDTLRLATLPSRAGGGHADSAATAAGGSGKGSSSSGAGAGSGGSWGARVKLDVQRAILGLTCHHVDAQVLVLTADGQLRGYAVAGSGGDVLTPLYAVQVQDAADKVVTSPGVLSCVPHPTIPAGALILQGSRLGTLAVLEAAGRGAPVPLFRGRVPGQLSTLGMGVCRNTGTVLSFGLNDGARLRCTAWRLSYRPGAQNVALRPSRVDPQDLTSLLDSGRRTRAGLAGGMLAGTLAAANGQANGQANGTAACAGLWGLSPAWVHDTPSSCLLDSQLGPLVGRVAVHPGLGLLAVSPEPPRGVVGNRDIMLGARGGLAAEEAALARRTSSVSLLLVSNMESHSGGWRAARTAPQHTPLAAWLPPGAVPAAAAAAAAAATAVDSSDDEAPAIVAADSGGSGSSGEDSGGTLELPPHVYFLAGTRLMKYALVSRSTSTLAQLPSEAPDGDTRSPRQLLHSPRAGAWLVFFEAAGAGNNAAAASGTSGGGTGGVGVGPSPERFSWTLLNGSSFAGDGGGGGATVTWIRPGKTGCFLGPSDAHFAIMSPNGKLLEVFDSAAAPLASGGAPHPLLSVSLEGGVLLPGLAAPLFAGPPMTNAPVPEARAPPDAPPHDLRRFRGSGVVMWQSGDCALSMTTLPALARVPLDAPPPAASRPAATYDSSSDDDAAAQPSYPTVPAGHYFGALQRQAHLPLLPQETIITVAWQNLNLLSPQNTTTTTLPTSPSTGAAADAVAAVLTSQRLLLVTAGLRVVASVSLATHGSPVLLEPLTSLLWAGPVLLVSTPAGQVLQMTWTGSLLPVACLSPTGHAALLGLTPDAMILLRTPLGAPPTAVTAAATAGGSGSAAAAAALAEAVHRPAPLLQPLLIGWASLAATGLLSQASTVSAGVVRPALRFALASHDMSALTPRGLWGLIAAGAVDVAAAIAAAMPPLDGAVRLAAAAAAGDWAEVKAALMAEASRALHAPAPPPRGSELHAKLLAAAAGSLSHGQLSVAGALFQAAGEWPAAMILAVCSGNTQEAVTVGQKLTAGTAAVGGGGGSGGSSAEARVATQLASALRNVYGGVGNAVGDLELTLTGPGRNAAPIDRAERWLLAQSLAAPTAVTVLGGLLRAAVHDSELGRIPSSLAERTAALSYYGLTLTAAASVAAAAAGAGGGASGRVTTAADHAGAATGGGGGGTSTAAGDLETASVASSDAAQAAARAEFFNQFGGVGAAGGPTIDFSSDEDTDSEATGSAAGTLGGGGMQRRIKIQIRDRNGAAGGPAAAGPTGGDSALREAAKSLRLTPPTVSTKSPGLPSMPSHTRPSPSGLGSTPPPAPISLTPPAQPPVAAPSPSSAAAPPIAPGAVQSSAQLYGSGVSHMEAGDWQGAAAHFARAMSVLQHEERGTLDEASGCARLGHCARYYAAVRLLEGVGGGAGPREARLYRYLAGLALEPRHASALLREAITRNRTVGNFKYAAEQLTALISQVADTAPAEYLAQLQAEIEECDRNGGRNAGLPSDEQVADWALLVAAASEGGVGGGKPDVDALVLPLLAD